MSICTLICIFDFGLDDSNGFLSPVTHLGEKLRVCRQALNVDKWFLIGTYVIGQFFSSLLACSIVFV